MKLESIEMHKRKRDVLRIEALSKRSNYEPNKRELCRNEGRKRVLGGNELQVTRYEVGCKGLTAF